MRKGFRNRVKDLGFRVSVNVLYIPFLDAPRRHGAFFGHARVVRVQALHVQPYISLEREGERDKEREKERHTRSNTHM